MKIIFNLEKTPANLKHNFVFLAGGAVL